MSARCSAMGLPVGRASLLLRLGWLKAAGSDIHLHTRYQRANQLCYV